MQYSFCTQHLLLDYRLKTQKNRQKQNENKESESLKRLSVQVNSLLQIEDMKDTKSQTQKMVEENRKINCEFTLSPFKINELKRLADLRKSVIEDF